MAARLGVQISGEHYLHVPYRRQTEPPDSLMFPECFSKNRDGGDNFWLLVELFY